MKKNSKIYIAGHSGLVGSTILKTLEHHGFSNLLTIKHQDLDLKDQQKTLDFFQKFEPEYVFLAAAKVGGIHANATYPADFILDNLLIQNNVMLSAYQTNVKKLMFLGSSCIYPKNCAQPMQVDSIMTGPVEETNEPYAMAKLAGLTLCQSFNQQYQTNFITVIPANLYGPNDNFHPKNSHVIPALIRRFHEAKQKNDSEVVIWGTGSARREFLFVDDLAKAVVFLMEHYNENPPINIGSNETLSIKELALVIKEVTGFKGEIFFDTTKPDGMPIKHLDCWELEQKGWKARVSIKSGLKKTYSWYLNNM